LLINTLSPNHFVSFTLDVDDTLKSSPLGNIMVAGNEIQGASSEIKQRNGEISKGLLGDDSQATIVMDSCR
jgi:hypothetical protein